VDLQLGRVGPGVKMSPREKIVTEVQKETLSRRVVRINDIRDGMDMTDIRRLKHKWALGMAELGTEPAEVLPHLVFDEANKYKRKTCPVL
jgi:hypothetical protein